jgi:hypothetical protein
MDLLSPVSFLWIMSASLITLGFYQRRRPAAWMDVRVGARIGVLVGVCLALEVGTAMAGAGLVARFGLHAMGGFDSQMAAQMQKAIQQSSTPVTAEMMGLLGSPEFRGGMILAGFAFLAAGLVVLSTLGGAFAGLLGQLRMRRGPRSILESHVCVILCFRLTLWEETSSKIPQRDAEFVADRMALLL